jgi:hypothetical protein
MVAVGAVVVAVVVEVVVEVVVVAARLRACRAL